MRKFVLAAAAAGAALSLVACSEAAPEADETAMADTETNIEAVEPVVPVAPVDETAMTAEETADTAAATAEDTMAADPMATETPAAE